MLVKKNNNVFNLVSIRNDSVNSLINVFINDFVYVKEKDWNPYNIRYLCERLSKLDEDEYDSFEHQVRFTFGYNDLFKKILKSYSYNDNDSVSKIRDRILNKEKEKKYDINKSESKIDIDDNKIYDKINIQCEMKTSSDFQSLFEKQEW